MILRSDNDSLNFNHFWMKGLAGYLLHPKIPTHKHGLRIADLGAGTGYAAVDPEVN